MAPLDDLRRVAGHLLRFRGSGRRRCDSDRTSATLTQTAQQEIAASGEEAHRRTAEGVFGFSGAPGEESLASMSAEELSAWENRDVPTVGRVSDDSEARADEKQDATTSLNFPLHWTSAKESWDYLFDFAVASELLAPRPDDLVLDFAAGTCWATELLGRLGVRTGNSSGGRALRKQ